MAIFFPSNIFFLCAKPKLSGNFALFSLGSTLAILLYTFEKSPNQGDEIWFTTSPPPLSYFLFLSYICCVLFFLRLRLVRFKNICVHIHNLFIAMSTEIAMVINTRTPFLTAVEVDDIIHILYILTHTYTQRDTHSFCICALIVTKSTLTSNHIRFSVSSHICILFFQIEFLLWVYCVLSSVSNPCAYNKISHIFER